MTITEQAKRYADLKRQYDAQDAALKKIGAEWTECENQLLEAMVDEGVKSTSLDGIGTFTMAVTNYLSVTAANKVSFYPYLKESGNGALLKEEVNPRTLTAFLKEHLEEVIKRFEGEGFDGVDARNKALEFLNQKGASYFTKREVRMTKGK